MIFYLDASALVKRYIAEPGTAEVAEAIKPKDLVAFLKKLKWQNLL